MSEKPNLAAIPEHLAGFDWYAPHQAWLSERKPPHHDPGSALPKRTNLSWASFGGVDLHLADLREADLRRIDLSKANLRAADFRGADLSGANFGGADLSDADLGEACLRGADFRGVDLSGANLSWASLDGANLSEANLSWTNLSRTNLGGANLGRANLRGANLREARLSGAYLRSATGLPVTLEQAIATLDAIREIVLAHPERCHMLFWHGDSSWKTRTREEEISCGTTHCLAGWAQVITRCGGEPWCDGILQIWPAAHMTLVREGELLEYLRNREYAN